jgi:hypothetical protein
MIGSIQNFSRSRSLNYWHIAISAGQLVKDYLQEINGDLPQEQWPLTLIGLATNAPEHNPIEHVWLNGKTQIRKQAGLKTFAQVKQCFVDTITANTYNYEKFNSYFP